MVPPKKSEEKEPKKRTVDGQMGYLQTRSTRENAYDKKKREIKKWKTSLQLARWRLEYNPLWGEGVLAGPLHSALMWAPFNFLSIFLLIFEQRFPHFSMEEFWRKLPTMMIITIEWKMPKNGKIKLISIENACISTNSKTKLSTVVNFGLTFITLSKSNGKQLCKKILFMKNNCGTMITTIYEIEIVTCLNLQYSTCLVSLIV